MEVGVGVGVINELERRLEGEVDSGLEGELEVKVEVDSRSRQPLPLPFPLPFPLPLG